MAGRSAQQLFREFSGNAEADVTMSLLRSADALLHLALMAAHLGDGQVGTAPARTPPPPPSPT